MPSWWRFFTTAEIEQLQFNFTTAKKCTTAISCHDCKSLCRNNRKKYTTAISFHNCKNNCTTVKQMHNSKNKCTTAKQIYCNTNAEALPGISRWEIIILLLFFLAFMRCKLYAEVFVVWVCHLCHLLVLRNTVDLSRVGASYQKVMKSELWYFTLI